MFSPGLEVLGVVVGPPIALCGVVGVGISCGVIWAGRKIAQLGENSEKSWLRTFSFVAGIAVMAVGILAGIGASLVFTIGAALTLTGVGFLGGGTVGALAGLIAGLTLGSILSIGLLLKFTHYQIQYIKIP